MPDSAGESQKHHLSKIRPHGLDFWSGNGSHDQPVSGWGFTAGAGAGASVFVGETATEFVFPISSPTAIAKGDPHFTTYDGLRFDYQGAGEFIAAKSTDPEHSFEVQLRMKASSGGAVSIISGTAMQVGEDRVTFDPNRKNPIWVDGRAVPISFQNPIFTLPGGAVQMLSPGAFRVIWNTGEVVDVSNNRANVTLASGDSPGTILGLLGSNDGNGNEFELPDGTVLQQPLSQQQLYKQFGDSWRVTDADSLFDYGPGETTATYTNTEFPLFSLSLSDIPQSVRDAAAALVAANGITDPTELAQQI
jgi:hypothetical protein